MDIAGIREVLHRQPFQPFSIRLADGRSLAVKHRDFVALGTRRIVHVAEDDSTTIIEPLLIVSLDIPPTSDAGNGSQSRRRKRGS
jgi:hypothetical protein